MRTMVTAPLPTQAQLCPSQAPVETDGSLDDRMPRAAAQQECEYSQGRGLASCHTSLHAEGHVFRYVDDLAVTSCYLII